MAIWKTLVKATTLSIVVMLTSCNDTSSLSSKDKKSTEKEDDENEEANVPVEVSGAFLTCDWAGEPSQSEDTLIGCAVNGKDGEPLDRQDRTFTLSLHDKDDTQVPMVTKDSSANTDWHTVAELPSSHRESGYLKMTVRKKQIIERTLILNTYDIGKSVSLGNFADEESTSTTSTESPLTRITTHSYWENNLKAIFHINLSDFCDSNGELRTTLSTGSDLAVSAVELLTKEKPVNTNIIVRPTAIAADSSTCFIPFKEMGGSRKLVHENSQKTCFYLHTANALHMINVPKGTEENPELNFDSLTRFASSKVCQ
jgi:hypothetical protein